MASDWLHYLNNTSCSDDVEFAFALHTANCQLVYVTACGGDEPDSDTYIASIDLPTGEERWRLSFPYNSVDTFDFSPFIQLNAAGTTLSAQRLLASSTDSCVELWGVAINQTAGQLMWNVSQCFPRSCERRWRRYSAAALWLIHISDNATEHSSYFLPWTSIKASTGAVLHEVVVSIAPFSLLSSIQSGGHIFSVQGLTITANVSDWDTITAVFCMSDEGVFELQSSRTIDWNAALLATTAGDTLMQGHVDGQRHVSDWVGLTVPEQNQRWQCSDDAILMWQ